jgi:hypothetical protein
LRVPEPLVRAVRARPSDVASFVLKAVFGTVSTLSTARTIIFTFAVIPGFSSMPGFATRTMPM